MKSAKKFASLLFSMRLALVILGIFVVACILGSVIPQGNNATYYTENYPRMGYLILALKLDDVFHCLWFCILTGLLCLNLMGCNLLRFPTIVRRQRQYFCVDSMAKRYMSQPAEPVSGEPDALFSRMGFRQIRQLALPDGALRYACRHTAGLWGAWLTHLGMLIIILGFALGQIFTQKYEVYGVPGTSKPIGDTGLVLTIEDFSVSLRQDDTVEQYTAELTVTDTASGQTRTGQSSVNHPWGAFGYTLYQNATGYAADLVVIRDLQEGETLTADQLLSRAISRQALCVGEYAPVDENHDLNIILKAMNADYTAGEDGLARIHADGYVYMLYYKGELLGMNVLGEGELITVKPFAMTFVAPRMYTLIEIRHDPFSWLTLIGGIVMLLALVLSFYVRTEEMWAVQDASGIWHVGGSSRKGGVLYQDKLRSVLQESMNKGDQTK